MGMLYDLIYTAYANPFVRLYDMDVLDELESNKTKMTTIEKKNRNIVIKPSLIFASILSILVLALVLTILFLYLKAFWFIQHGGNTPGPRLDCGLEPNSTKEICLNRGCLWDDRYEKTQPDIPNCYFPPNTGYIATKFYENSTILMKKQNSVKNPYGEDFNTLIFKANRIGAGLHISIYPPNVER
uniref:P-type domain-containing protein n=1 Tax=Acrobeloides nanus TaxID=290746 RepID=A0A914EGP7_9BILA